jgi:hypothetical protein
MMARPFRGSPRIAGDRFVGGGSRAALLKREDDPGSAKGRKNSESQMTTSDVSGTSHQRGEQRL